MRKLFVYVASNYIWVYVLYTLEAVWKTSRKLATPARETF